jgi:hypothetical protein
MNSNFTTRKRGNLCAAPERGTSTAFAAHTRPKHEGRRSFVGCEQQVDNQHVEV